MIAGDFNIHVDDESDVHAGKLMDLLSCHNLRQHVTCPTHVQGHTLDLLITRDDQPITVLPVDPPLLSDHSFVVADLDHAPPSATSIVSVRSETGVLSMSTPLRPISKALSYSRHQSSALRLG